MIKTIRVVVFVFLTGLSLSVLVACSGSYYPALTPTPQGQFPISSDFRDFYQTLGGEAELGPAISAPFNRSGILCQYTTNVLMCFNPAARSEIDRWYLAPLGKQLNYQSLSGLPANTQFKVFEGFSEAYHKKFLARYVGQPLTGVRYNPDKHRIEQYFENMGFYILVDDPQRAVQLLAYGSYSCREECTPAGSLQSTIIGWDKGIEVANPGSLDRLGGYTLFGDPLTLPFLATDGNLEQVLDKVVVYVPADNPATLRFRSIATILNLPFSEPSPQHFGKNDNMVFYMTKGDLGYHVPIVFDRFIASHGGMEISGKPLSDPYQISEGNRLFARQCFEKYCLEYNPNAADDQKVSLTSLGQTYLKVQKREGQQLFRFNRKTVNLIASEAKPQISNLENQIIQIMLSTRQSHQPIADIESFVILGLPDGKKISYNLPPTNANGLAQITIAPLTNAPNGAIIPYIVCLNIPAGEQICANESFLIWNTR